MGVRQESTILRCRWGLPEDEARSGADGGWLAGTEPAVLSLSMVTGGSSARRRNNTVEVMLTNCYSDAHEIIFRPYFQPYNLTRLRKEFVVFGCLLNACHLRKADCTAKVALLCSACLFSQECLHSCQSASGSCASCGAASRA